uniref:Prolyl 4-hydroxylase alpha subunit domain-containing protein n=1 Tax=Bicosoecida sp. CB-2014 TaxID=1486930 RepID=A0A7S1C1B7_9STRA|mmetsp:Transcript_10123/g.35470  ORF Transcript_10123/g.35470 Transcript_10123/m.35470 type:complete len:329 (+) Transcript_10123:46-1032(+)
MNAERASGPSPHRLTVEEALGPWHKDLDSLCSDYQSSSPFAHVQVRNFLNEDLAERLAKEFPKFSTDGLWDRYFNPLEVKLGISDQRRMPNVFQELFEVLCSDEVAEIMRRLTGIRDLRADKLLYGSGLHCSPAGGKLDMHLDYSVHPLTGEERRLNLILYLTPEWNAAWGGALDLADPKCERIVDSFPCEFNSAGIFETGDISYHGFPRPIACPAHVSRNSLALYYVSDLRPDVSRRFKAKFGPLGGVCSPGMRALYDIRVHRRIFPEDVDTHMPGWHAEQATSLTAAIKPYAYSEDEAKGGAGGPDYAAEAEAALARAKARESDVT